MARLNEPAPPVESIESLKRRFMRQNRDIARANSTQSLRIRNLENETSRLLAENLGLREQILRLKSELENNRAQQIVENTRITKSQLEEKLLELGALISGLGDEPSRKLSPQVTKQARESLSRSPGQRDWKNMYTMSEVVGGLDGRLPPIMENKSYPRTTLEMQELEAIISDEAADVTDSPEIGPPPISQFIDEDPIKVDLAIRPHKMDSEELLDLDPAFSVNLEHRKKRKDSIGGSESRRLSKVELVQGERESTNPLKTGAKRKLSVRDDDEGEISAKPVDVSPEDFKFTRVIGEDRSKSKVMSQPEKSGNRGTREFATAKGAPRDKQTSSTASTNRKALAPKSVNDSPMKSTKIVTSEGMKAANIDGSKPIHAKERLRERIQEPLPIKSRPEVVIKAPEGPILPETPAALDIFSPSSSQPSTRAESRDTPPPPELGPRGDGPRPSRRSRGSVSYAEPNLRAKMRRPTNEFVDAVAVAAQQHQHDTIKVEENSASNADKVKTEPNPDSQWKRRSVAPSAIENSPLSGKASGADSLPSNITTHRKRRESILNQSDTELRGTGSAIAALLAEKRRAKADVREKGLHRQETAAKAADDLDIYDFRGSSPDHLEEAPVKNKEEKPASKYSRRHTAIVRDGVYVEDSDASDVEAARRGRRQSTLSLRSSITSTESEKEGDGEKTLRKSTSTPGIADPAGGSRSDRIAARRRSMML